MVPTERAVVQHEGDERFIVRASTRRALAYATPDGHGCLLWRVSRTEGTRVLSRCLLLPDDDLSPGSPAYLRIVEAIVAVWGVWIYLVHKYEMAEIRSSAFRKILAPFKALLAETEGARRLPHPSAASSVRGRGLTVDDGRRQLARELFDIGRPRQAHALGSGV